MATYSTTAIINYALVLCGTTTVSSITDNTPNARALNSVYEIARLDFLTECKWNFSTTRTTLATVASSTISWFHVEEAYVYSRPSAALRIWEMSDDNAVWRVEGDYIISNTANLGAKYSWDQSDLSKWTPFAINAFIDKLAADISYTILNSPQKSEAFLKKYKSISLPKAMSENSQTGTQQIVKDDDILASKFQDGYGGNPARSYG